MVRIKDMDMTDCDYFLRVIAALTYLLPALPSRDYDEEKGKEREEKDNEKTTLWVINLLIWGY